MKKRLIAVSGLIAASMIVFTGCGSSAEKSITDNSVGGSTVSIQNDSAESSNAPVASEENTSAGDSTSDSAVQETDSSQTSTLTARFGYEGEAFTLHLYDNDTAAAIAKHVGSSDWNLPIYHYDDFDNWEVMQYYDIPNRYEIPSAAKEVTAEKAGEVYYSEPNRIILFYQDAEVSAEYTPVGYFDNSAEFVDAVENNPVLEGWGNKIISISPGE
ncbi:MAG: cyclophilin-like fold protein [Bacillus sp. (in: Bacteria)]|nr:cyclophilin-like fold protein [Bacillus sp. (in: firmicutes)]MCM1428084.1 cyclophilin-like fold protein [Eubacterium sp.]